MKRILLLALAMLLLVACGDSITGPSSGTIVFVLDGATCGTANRGSLTLYIDGSSVGTFEAAGNRESPRYTVSAGQHTLSASVWDSGTWGPRTVTIKAGDTFTYTLAC